MKTCPDCGKCVRDEVKFCKYCRHAFSGVVTDAAVPPPTPAASQSPPKVPPEDTMASNLEKAAKYLSAGRIEEHRKTITEAVSIECRDPELLWELCKSLNRLKEYESLTKVCRRILAIDPEHKALATLAGSLELRGHRAEAIEVYRQVLKIWPDHVRAGYSIAQNLFQDSRSDEPKDRFVLDAMQNVVKNPNGFSREEISGAKIRAAKILIGSGDLSGGLKLLEGLDEATVSSPNRLIAGSSWADAAEGFIASGKSDDAMICLQWAIQWADDRTYKARLSSIVETRVKNLLDSGAPDKAFEAARHVPEVSESAEIRKLATEALIGKCDMLRKQGDGKSAAECIDLAMELLPEDDSALKANLESRQRLFRQEASVRRTKIGGVLAGLAIMAAATFLMLYMAHGSITITVPNATTMSLMKGNKIAANSTTETIEVPQKDNASLPWSGSYQLKASAPAGGFAPLETEVVVPFWRKHADVDVAMKVQAGVLNVNTVPAGAVVTLSNAFQKLTCASPCTLRDVMTVPSTLEYSLSRLPKEKRYLTPQDGVTTDVEPVVFPAYVTVVSNPSGADIVVDGSSTGKLTPASLSLGQTGQHTISGTLPGYLVEGPSIKTHNGLPMDVQLSMTPLYGTMVVQSSYEDGIACAGNVTIDDENGNSWRRIKVLARSHSITVNCRLGSAGTSESAIHKKNVNVPILVPSAEGAVRDGLILNYNSQFWYPVVQNMDLPVVMTWEEADSYCKSLQAGHLVGWRLPTGAELTALLEIPEQKLRKTADSYGWLLYSFASGVKSWVDIAHWTMDQEIQEYYDDSSATAGVKIVELKGAEQYFAQSRMIPVTDNPDSPSPYFVPPTGQVFCVRDL